MFDLQLLAPLLGQGLVVGAHVHLRGDAKRELEAGEAIELISAWPHWRCMFQPIEGEADVGHWAVWHVDGEGGSQGEAMTFLSVSEAALARLPQGQ